MATVGAINVSPIRLAAIGFKQTHKLLQTHPATGVQITSSIRGAPVASITSRSNPKAIPLAGGISASASRNSSSNG